MTNLQMIELKPCPFCGNTEVIYIPLSGCSGYVFCTDCNMATKTYWENTPSEISLKEAGLVFRTKEECEAALPALRKKYLGGDDNV